MTNKYGEAIPSTAERFAWLCLLIVFTASTFVGLYVLGVMTWEFVTQSARAICA